MKLPKELLLGLIPPHMLDRGLIVLEETLTLPKIFGGCLVISAVIILARSEYETSRAKISQSIPR